MDKIQTTKVKPRKDQQFLKESSWIRSNRNEKPSNNNDNNQKSPGDSQHNSTKLSMGIYNQYFLNYSKKKNKETEEALWKSFYKASISLKPKPVENNKENYRSIVLINMNAWCLDMRENLYPGNLNKSVA